MPVHGQSGLNALPNFRKPALFPLVFFLASAWMPGLAHTQSVSGAQRTPPAPSLKALGNQAMIQAGRSELPLTSRAAQLLYGPGVFRQDTLGNTIIGIHRQREQIVSNRFRARISGHLGTARLYWQPGNGYSAGDGGTIRLRLLPDDGSHAHAPNLGASPLATAYFTPGQAAHQGRPIFADTYFSSQRPLTAGQIYHLVMDNIHPSSDRNYISSNNSVTRSDNGRPSRWISPTDWATLLGSRAAWSGQSFSWLDMTRTAVGGNYYVPILQLRTREGQSQGVSAMESGAIDPGRIFTATRNHPVRERFHPDRTHRIIALSVATAAAVKGALQWRIVQGGHTMASGQFYTGSANYRVLANRVGKIYWYDAPVGGPKGIVLAAGQTYDVEFQPAGVSQWKFADFRNGSHHGFSAPAAFTESNAQHRVNGAWLNAYHFNHNISAGTDSNWPIVLHLAP